MQKQILDQIILQLKQVDVDGESMEYIIREVGMEDQMLRQLLLKADMELVQELVEEKALLSMTRIRMSGNRSMIPPDLV